MKMIEVVLANIGTRAGVKQEYVLAPQFSQEALESFRNFENGMYSENEESKREDVVLLPFCFILKDR